jgi:hypothetical protein
MHIELSEWRCVRFVRRHSISLRLSDTFYGRSMSDECSCDHNCRSSSSLSNKPSGLLASLFERRRLLGIRRLVDLLRLSIALDRTEMYSAADNHPCAFFVRHNELSQWRCLHYYLRHSRLRLCWSVSSYLILYIRGLFLEAV